MKKYITIVCYYHGYGANLRKQHGMTRTVLTMSDSDKNAQKQAIDYLKSIRKYDAGGLRQGDLAITFRYKGRKLPKTNLYDLTQ